MKYILIALLSSCLFCSSYYPSNSWATEGSYLVAKVKKKAKKKRTTKKRSAKKRSTQKRKRIVRKKNAELTKALKLAKSGNYEDASVKLFSISMSPKYKRQRNQIKYILGMMLYQMKLYQLSAFQFISVVKAGNSKYLKQSIEKLSLAADALGDDTLLNYALSKIKIEDFPKAHRDMLYYRIGEYQMRAKNYAQATKSFSRVKRTSSKFNNAKYLQALAYAEVGKTKKSLDAFMDLFDSNADREVTDSSRVSALMGMARVLYQEKKWDESLEKYRQVPRDTEVWHDTLFETSWAMLRSGRFRSALSNFQTLHSSFYEDFYLPESILLRAIVYLYICKYDEMEKVLNLFEKIYKPVTKQVNTYLKNTKSPEMYYEDIYQTMKEFDELGDRLDKTKFKLPFVVARRLSKEGDYQRAKIYIEKLKTEKRHLKEMPGKWRSTSLGRYSVKIIDNRIKKATRKVGRQIKRHLYSIKSELLDLLEQEGFIRFEMINGRKEVLKKKVAGKELPSVQVDEEKERDFYIQNGYQYWPFDGESWLDELGNYHYVGTQSCE